MTYTQLLALVQAAKPRINICADSGYVTDGDVFVAIKGTQVDGHEYIDAAIDNGAAYIVCHAPPPPVSVPAIVVENSAVAFGQLAQASFGNPASKITSLAVTGTNGKTTVCYLVRSIIEAANQKCGMIGTINYDTGDRSIPAPLTTPDAATIASLQQQMVNASTKFMAIEASSHALSQHRLAGINFTAAAFTNLTGDHLDYHQTLEQYLKAKSVLFENLPIHGVSILNAQSPQAKVIAKQTDSRILWYAIDAPADITAHIDSMDVTGAKYQLNFDGQKQTVTTTLTGKHNISNQLAAAGLCLAAGFDLSTIAKGLSSIDRVPGRLDAIDLGQPFSVLVDYAHTDDALKNVMETLKPLCKGRLIVLFGCGGDRDKTKRPRMAAIAEQLADIVIVTSDNPRTESPVQIIADIAAGFTGDDISNITIEPDRKKAIEYAIQIAAKDDIVLLAGKGHEDYQIIGKEKTHFDDKEIAAQAIKDLEQQ